MLANLSTDQASITKVLSKRGRRPPSPSRSEDSSPTDSPSEPVPETSQSGQSTLKATLAATPGKCYVSY